MSLLSRVFVCGLSLVCQKLEPRCSPVLRSKPCAVRGLETVNSLEAVKGLNRLQKQA